MDIVVIRLSGRTYRDLRITTHVALVARAFGANKIIFESTTDNGIQETLRKISQEFGGEFEVDYETKMTNRIRDLQKKGYVGVHLTMYGEKPQPVVDKIKREKKNKIMIIVGADKVKGDIYQQTDYNVSITTQPHSEVAALAVFLHYLQEGKEEELTFKNAKKIVEPNPRGKTVRSTRDI